MKALKRLKCILGIVVASNCLAISAPAQPDWIDEFFAGCFGGAVGVGGAQPFDTVRVRMQTGFGHGTGMQTALMMVKREGIACFWRGSIPPIFGTGLQNGILFGTNEFASRYVGKDTLLSFIVAGGLGGATQAVVCTPLELLKTREQIRVTPPSWRDTFVVARNIWALEGGRGLFRGLGPTLVRDVPSYGLYFYVYKRITEVLNKRELPTWMATFIGGGVAGMAAWASIYPIDVAKSKIQASTSNHPYDLSLIPVLKAIYKTGGRGALFYGFGVTMLRAFVLNGFTFLGFESSMRALRHLRDCGRD